MEHLYNKFEEDKEFHDYQVQLSFVEIYNETVQDLLSDPEAKRPSRGLTICKTEKNKVTIAGVVIKRPTSVAEVMDLVMTGNQRRATAFTHSNAVSSRSHAVLQVSIARCNKGTVVDFDNQTASQSVTSATFSLIDLAGSERAAASKNNGERQKEGAKINRSLLALSSCITALCERPTRGRKPHVPYRDSQLTRLLEFSLGGNCRTAMIVCVSPSSRDIDDTHNTLMWANRAKDIKTMISKNTGGVTIRVQQYLDRIAAQQMRIDELEAERLAGPKITENAAVVQRRERDRVEVRQALDGLDAEVDAHLAVINEGAEKRALWDVSQLTVTALIQRIQDLQNEINTRGAAIVERDAAYLRTRVEDEQSKFHGNTHVLKMVQREVQRTKTIEKHIANVSSRSFEDLPPLETEALKLALDSKRRQVDLEVYASREKGYRAMHRHHANMQAITQHHVYSQKENLQGLIDQMMAAGGTAAQFVNQLKAEVERSETVLSTAHGDLAPITDALPPPVSFKDVEAFILPLPPTPAPQRAVSMSFAGNRPELVSAPFGNRLDLLSPSKYSVSSPIKHLSMPAAFGHPSPSSSSSLPSVPSTTANNPFHIPSNIDPVQELAPTNKAVARVRGVRAAPGTPRRKAPGTPGKRAFAAKRSALKASSSLLPKLPGKTMRWKSDNSITEEKTMSSIQTGSGSDDSPGDSSWQDEDAGAVSPIPPISTLPAKRPMGLPKRSSIAPTSAPTSAVPALRVVPTIAPPKPLAPVSLGPLSTAPAPPAGNDWKAARARIGHNPYGMSTVNENGPVSPLAAGNTSSSVPKFGLMAPPPSRAPLGESRMNPTAVASSSRLSMPTAASAAKSVGADISLSLAAARDTRRESSLHLSRIQRNQATSKYARPSLLATKSDDSSDVIHPLLRSELGQPTKRRESMAPSGQSRIPSPIARPGSGPGPRESISASTTLTNARAGLKSRASVADFGIGRPTVNSLSSRPSISNLRGTWRG
jgi:kinesin family protein 18/19